MIEILIPISIPQYQYSFPNWIPLEQWKNEKSKKRTIDTQQQQQSIVTSFSSINQDDASTTTTTSNGSKLAKKRKITNSPPPTQPTQPSQPINFLHNFPTNGTGPTFFMTTTTTTLMINQPPQPPPPSTTTTTQFPPSFLSLQTPQTPQTPQLPMIRQSSSIPLDDLFPDLLSKVGAGDHHSDNDHETSINSPTISPQDLSSLLTSPEGHQQQIDGMEQSHSIPPSISDDHWAYSTTTTTTSAAAMRVRRSSRNVNQNEIENENENQNETSYTNEEEQDHHSLNTPTLSMPIDDTLLSPTESISTPETPNDDDSTTTSPTNTIIKSSNKGGTLKSGGARKRGKTPNVRTDFPTNLKVIGRESFLDYQQIMAMKAPEHKVDAFELFKVLAKNLKKWKEIKAALYPGKWKEKKKEKGMM